MLRIFAVQTRLEILGKLLQGSVEASGFQEQLSQLHRRRASALSAVLQVESPLRWVALEFGATGCDDCVFALVLPRGTEAAAPVEPL